MQLAFSFGFRGCLIDHTGIDIIAYRCATGARFGITVKSRTRLAGSENVSVNLFSHQGGKDDRQKVLNACKFFECTPWIAAYVETAEQADLYLTSLENYDTKYRRQGRAMETWSMSRKCRKLYASDPAVAHIHITFEALNWVVTITDHVGLGALRAGLPSRLSMTLILWTAIKFGRIQNNPNRLRFESALSPSDARSPKKQVSTRTVSHAAGSSGS